jgi:outer membrane lipoprotein-sorting protein
MSNRNETHDQGCLDNNLDRLLGLGEPAPGMPEDLKARIRSKLTEAGRESVKKRIFPLRWAMWPVAATVLAAVILIVLWYGNSSTAIAWADVQGQFNQVHTLTLSALTGISANTGIRITERYKVYFKDPGLSRIEEYPPDAGSDPIEKEPRKITIIRREPGSNERVTLYPEVGRAELIDSVLLTDGPGPPSQPGLNFVQSNWELIKKTTSDKTRRIGDRIINGVPATGFEFEIPGREYVNPDSQIRARLWASGEDGTPLLIEIEYRDPLGQNMRMEYSDIQWNVPPDESLFDLAVPEGWSLSRIRTESAEYANAGLVPGVTLQIGPDGREPLTATEDVVRVVRGDQTTHLDSNVPPDARITIELKPEAIQRLRDYARANPKELIIVDFNRQIKVVPNFYGAGPTQLSFDVSLLDLPLAELETRYFTTTIERNGL